MANLYTTKTDGIDIVYAADVNELQAGVGFAHMPGGRLTLETGVPISTTDQSAKTTLYYTAYTSNRIPLYSGSAWQLVNFSSDLSITLVGLTGDLPYDVFCYNNSGTATLELLAWTNTTTRATALTRQDGRYVKTGATTRLYLGTILIDVAGGACTDSTIRRGVSNAYNRAAREIKTYNTTASWTYATAAYQESNNGTGQVRGVFVTGLPGTSIVSVYNHSALADGTYNADFDLALDGLASGNRLVGYSVLNGNIRRIRNSSLSRVLSVGSHYITTIEYCYANTAAFVGNSLGPSIMVEM